MAKKFNPERDCCQFMRDHLELRLMRYGFTEDKAVSVVSQLTDEELTEFTPKMKMKGPFKNFLSFLKDNKEQIMDGVEKVFNLLALVIPLVAAKGGEDEEEPEEEDEEDTEAEEEDDEDAPRKSKR
jgi:hypothetical protein